MFTFASIVAAYNDSEKRAGKLWLKCHAEGAIPERVNPQASIAQTAPPMSLSANDCKVYFT